MWSAGVMLYWLFTSQLPFFANGATPPPRGALRIEDIAAAVNGAPITYNWGPWRDMSPQGLDFMRGLLERGEDSRMAAEDALAHPWLREHFSEDELSLTAPHPLTGGDGI